jgi:hypothetical protein
MSLIENSEIFRAKHVCENANSLTIAAIFPAFKKTSCILQKKYPVTGIAKRFSNPVRGRLAQSGGANSSFFFSCPYSFSPNSPNF